MNDAYQTAKLVRRTASDVRKDPGGYARDIGREVIDQASKAWSNPRGAYLYPLAGLQYFVTNRDIHSHVGGTIVKGAITSAIITVGMFVFTYLPQAAFMSLFMTPIAGFPAATVVVLVEAYFIVGAITKVAFIEPLQDELFDRVLKKKGHQALYTKSDGRLSRQSPVTKLLRRQIDRFGPKQIARYILTFPLNFVPVVGSALFFLMNGYATGKTFHTRYFRLKGWDKESVREFTSERKGQYITFGVVSLALSMIPVAGIFFAATSTVGAALWASEMEARGEGNKFKEADPSSKQVAYGPLSDEE